MQKKFFFPDSKIESIIRLLYTFKKMDLMCMSVFIKKKNAYGVIFGEIWHFQAFLKNVKYWPKICVGPPHAPKKNFFFGVKKKIKNFRSFSFICEKTYPQRVTSVKYRDPWNRQSRFFPYKPPLVIRTTLNWKCCGIKWPHRSLGDPDMMRLKWTHRLWGDPDMTRMKWTHRSLGDPDMTGMKWTHRSLGD